MSSSFPEFSKWDFNCSSMQSVRNTPPLMMNDDIQRSKTRLFFSPHCSLCDYSRWPLFSALPVPILSPLFKCVGDRVVIKWLVSLYEVAVFGKTSMWNKDQDTGWPQSLTHHESSSSTFHFTHHSDGCLCRPYRCVQSFPHVHKG